MAGLTKTKRYRNTAARRRMNSGVGAASQLTRRTPITITSSTPGDTTVVQFDQAVILAGIPQWLNNSAHLPLTAVLSAPNELTLTYPGADTTTSFTVPFEDPAIRNGAGGYLLPGIFSGD